MASFLSGWKHRVEITVPSALIGSNLTHFSLLLKLGTSVGTGNADVSFIFDELTSDANKKKIAVTKSDGTTEIYVEIEKWDDANEVAWLWVSKSDLVLSSSADTILWLYFDVDHADNTNVGLSGDHSTATEAVWRTERLANWHLSEATDATCKDSTDSDLDSAAELFDSIAGQIGPAADLNGTADYIQVARSVILEPTTEVSVGLIVKLGTVVASQPTDFPLLVQKYQYADDKGYGLLLIKGDETLQWTAYINGAWRNVIYDVSGWDTATFYHIVGVYRDYWLRLFVNGAEVGTPIDMTDKSITQHTTQAFNIGAHGVAAAAPDTNFFDGITDEAFVSSEGLSNDWIAADHYTKTDALVSWGALRDLHSGVVAITPGVGATIVGNYITGAAVSVAPTVGLVSVANRIASAVAAIAPTVGIVSGASRIADAVAAIVPEVGLAMVAESFTGGTMSIEAAVSIATVANVIRSGVAAIGPAVSLVSTANRIADAVTAIGPGVDLVAIGNRIADAGVDITAAVSIVAVANAIKSGVVGIAPEVALAAAAVLISSGVIDITPEADVESIANFLWASASAAIGPAVDLVSAANRIADAAAEIGPAADLAMIGNRIATGEVDITAAVSLATIAGIIRDGHTDITVAVAVASAAIALFSGVAAITPAVSLAVAGIRLASAVVAITPEADVEVIGNYITLAVATIGIAVSQSALCTKVVIGGPVTITVDASVSVTAIRYLLTILGLSGDLAAGSVIEIDSKKMTFKIDGANALKDMVGDWPSVPPGDSTVTYEDDEGSRDVDLDLEYTERDA